ncbi:hypothetical protein BGZ60DRAFT_35522 [Tricladium varicosporioides]|nr:hypothetical protein BGZ60DRAFT_35522 [Hymenoscyphus varicosporioides]
MSLSSLDPVASNPETDGRSEEYSCNFCNKKFEKRLSRNRHVLYCRQKRLQPIYSRKKACSRCRQARTRCDQVIPQCSRCKLKNVECIYDEVPLNTASLQLPQIEPPSNTNPRKTSTLDCTQYPVNRARSVYISNEISDVETWHDSIASQPLEMPYVASTSTNDQAPLIPVDHETSLEWSTSNQDVVHINGSLIPNRTENEYISSGPALVRAMPHNATQVDTLLGISTSCDPNFTNGFWESPHATTDLVTANIVWKQPMSNLTPLSTLFLRRQQSFGSQIGGDFLLQTLKSYPRVLLSNNLPLFIHQNVRALRNLCVTRPNTTETQPTQPAESLDICRTMVQIHSSKSKELSASVWRAIDLDLNRFTEQYEQMDVWDLMASLQAVALYIILAITDNDSPRCSLDEKLLFTMMTLALKIEVTNYLSTSPSTTLSEWQAWVLMESRNRVFSLLFIINMLFNVEPHPDNQVCNSIGQIPLPANKSLWEAKTSEEWEKAHTAWASARDGRPPLTYGDMVTLQQNGRSSDDPRWEDLDDWYLNLDAFGTFVLMAATSI